MLITVDQVNVTTMVMDVTDAMTTTIWIQQRNGGKYARAAQQLVLSAMDMRIVLNAKQAATDIGAKTIAQAAAQIAFAIRIQAAALVSTTRK